MIYIVLAINVFLTVLKYKIKELVSIYLTGFRIVYRLSIGGLTMELS
jgi:hypothetical protein